MNREHLLCSLTAALLAATAPAQAQSSDLHDWTSVGDVLIDSSSAAHMSTAALESGEAPLSAQSALLYFALEPALALAPGTLAADTLEGSGLQLNFITLAGSTIAFHWSLSTLGYDPLFADRAFAVIDGSMLTALGTVAASEVTGSFTHTFDGAGSHALALVVMDVNDTAGVSTLAISDFSVSSVPEPESWALLLAGGMAVARFARRREPA